MTSKYLPIIVGIGAAALFGVGCQSVKVLPQSGGERFGVAYSPRGHLSSVKDEDVREFFKTASERGRIVAFHTNWRDGSVVSGDVPRVAQFAAAAAKEFGILPVVGFGWTRGDTPDLTSAEEPKNNSWTNAETRQKFREMVTSYAKTYKPRYLFLGNEIEGYFIKASKKDWEAWVSEFAESYEAIKGVSPETVVYTTFNLERLKGMGRKNGWKNGPQWEIIKDFKKIDAVGFTSYPYFDFEKPSAIPDDYYAAIKKYWDGPVIFTEIGWLAKKSGPYAGSEADQAEFVRRFFELTKNLDVKYTAWLFLHDLDKAPPAFDGIGLKTNSGAERPAYAAWKEIVARGR